MEPIRKVEPIPSEFKVNPDYISQRDIPVYRDFKERLDLEIQKRLKQQNKKVNP